MEESCDVIKKQSKHKVSESEIIIFVVVLLLTFQGLLEDILPIFSFIDECSTMLILGYGILRWVECSRYRISKYTFSIIFGVILFSVFGWISTLLYNYQGIKVSLNSYLLSCIFFITIVGCIGIVVYDEKDLAFSCIKRMTRPIMIMVLVWQWILSLLPIVNGINRLSFCGLIVFCCSIIIADYKKRDILYLMIGILALILQGLSKSYGAALLIVIIYTWILKFQKKIRLLGIVTAGILSMLLVWDEIYYYYIEGIEREFPRPMAFLKGAEIANEYFPLGTGWGTFGTYYAVKVYSPVYIKLGWENHSMLGRVNGPQFLMDTYWPGIYAEAGWIGLVGIIIIMGALLFCILNMFKFDKKIYAASLLAYGFMFITTIESTSFAHPAYYILSIPIGVSVGKYIKINKDGKQ